MGVFSAATGFAAGYVLGARAGRGRYDQLTQTARELAARPQVRDLKDKLTGTSQQSPNDPAAAEPTPAPEHRGGAQRFTARRRRRDVGDGPERRRERAVGVPDRVGPNHRARAGVTGGHPAQRGSGCSGSGCFGPRR